MKKLLLSILFLMAGISVAKADGIFLSTNSPPIGFNRLLPNIYVSEAFYFSSATCANGAGVITSTNVGNRTIIYGIDVTSAGAGGSKIEAFNSSVSTQFAQTNFVTPIDGTKAQWHPMNLFLSSGLSVNNSNPTGAAVPCITIYYQDRK